MLNEDFYQANKDIEFTYSYKDPKPILSTENLIPCLIETNLEKVKSNTQINTRLTFAEDAFSPEQLALVPQLGKEFILDSKLSNFANSLTTGAIRSVLLYGPAGTGKSMTCKLHGKP